MSDVAKALVIADGSAPTRAALDSAWPGWDADTDLVVAADGGARLAEALGLTIDLWVGDGDSLGAAGLDRLRSRGIPVERSSREKDATDTELGLLAAIAAGATQIVIIGGLGGPRPDHALANVALLGHPAAVGRALAIVDPGARIRLLTGPAGFLDLSGRVGDVVSLIPLEPVAGITTTGLRYPLHGDALPIGLTRGISNVRTLIDATVTIQAGRLLVVETPATLST